MNILNKIQNYINPFNFKNTTDMPFINVDALAFAPSDIKEKEKKEYALTISDYLWKKSKPRMVNLFLCLILLTVFVGITTGIVCYNKGFKDNQTYAPDNSPVVIVTKNGQKYHKRNCSYISNGIEISRKRAEEQGYSACSKCRPEKIK